MVSFFQAGLYESMAAIYETMDQLDADPELAFQAAAAEIGAALRLTRRAADAELSFALRLARLPRVAQALTAGDIDLRRAKTIIYCTSHLPEATARAVVAQVIDNAARMTTGQLQALLRRLCIETDPEQAARRYEEAVAGRRVIAEPSVEGTAHLLGLDLPPDRVAAIVDGLSRMAQALKTAGEARTIDQLRADILLDLLEGQGPLRLHGRKGMVDLHVDLATLAGLDETPGELAGYGPVIADIARQVAEQQLQAEWRWTLTHPHTGLPVASGTTRRRPTAHQRRYIEARYSTCVFPGCRRPSTTCDLDHRIPWSEGGPTTTCNLAPLCRYHHRFRHRAGWRHRPLPHGDHLWTSRLGHQYTTSGLSPPQD
jgi:hypothetical protein